MRDREALQKLIGQMVTARKKENQLCVGVDLGTSWTAVMSEGGFKYNDRTIVGYPKDIIGRRVVGSNCVFGEAALRQRSSLNLYFPLESGVIKDVTEKDIAAATEVLTYVVRLAQQGTDNEMCGIIGVPARASIFSKELLLNIAKDVLHSAVVVSEPFLVAYNLGKLHNSIIVDIGAGSIDICGVKGMLPREEDQITLMTAGNHIDQCLMTAIGERYPDVQLTRNLSRKLKEAHSFVGAPSSPVVVTLRAKGKPGKYEVTEEIRSTCESIVPDIVEAIQSIIRGFDPENQADALENIYLAGGGSRIKGLDEMIKGAMKGYGKVRVQCVKDPVFGGCAGAIKLAHDVAPQFWDAIGTMLF
ncbi:MAG: MamK family actin-like protein [Thermodesulfobacteriota bacterium]